MVKPLSTKFVKATNDIEFMFWELGFELVVHTLQGKKIKGVMGGMPMLLKL